jgi:hypothetical protein
VATPLHPAAPPMHAATTASRSRDAYRACTVGTSSRLQRRRGVCRRGVCRCGVLVCRRGFLPCSAAPVSQRAPRRTECASSDLGETQRRTLTRGPLAACRCIVRGAVARCVALFHAKFSQWCVLRLKYSSSLLLQAACCMPLVAHHVGRSDASYVVVCCIFRIACLLRVASFTLHVVLGAVLQRPLRRIVTHSRTPASSSRPAVPAPHPPARRSERLAHPSALAQWLLSPLCRKCTHTHASGAAWHAHTWAFVPSRVSAAAHAMRMRACVGLVRPCAVRAELCSAALACGAVVRRRVRVRTLKQQQLPFGLRADRDRGGVPHRRRRRGQDRGVAFLGDRICLPAGLLLLVQRSVLQPPYGRRRVFTGPAAVRRRHHRCAAGRGRAWMYVHRCAQWHWACVAAARVRVCLLRADGHCRVRESHRFSCTCGEGSRLATLNSVWLRTRAAVCRTLHSALLSMHRMPCRIGVLHGTRRVL